MGVGTKIAVQDKGVGTKIAVKDKGVGVSQMNLSITAPSTPWKTT